MTSINQSVDFEIWIGKKHFVKLQKKIFSNLQIQRRLSMQQAFYIYHQLLMKFQKGIICQTFQLYIHSDESTTDT